MLPRHNRRADATGDLRRFIACLQGVADPLLSEVDRYPDLFDLERAPEAFLHLILRGLGNPFPFDLDVLGKRRDFNPDTAKYDFRVFLLHLGLIGGELRAASRSRPSDLQLRSSRPVSSLRSEAVVKTARLHQMANLNGSAAWKHGRPEQQPAACPVQAEQA